MVGKGSLIAFLLLYTTLSVSVGYYRGIQDGHKECNHIKNNTGNPYSALIKLDNGIDNIILYTDPSCRQEDVERDIVNFHKLRRDTNTSVRTYDIKEVDFRGQCD